MNKIIVVVSCILFAGCQNQKSESDHNNTYAAHPAQVDLVEGIEVAPPRSTDPSALPKFELKAGSKMVKTGDLHFEVTDLGKSKAQVDSLVKSLNGFIVNESYFSEGNQNSYTLIIRTPNKEFDSLMSGLNSGFGRVLSSNINVSDVTEEYVDLNIRLKNNLSYLGQYRVILKKANSIKEILEVEEKIRELEEEIESKEGRLKYLDDQVTYSTLTLKMSEWKSTVAAADPIYTIRILNAFKTGTQLLFEFVLFLFKIWPFVLIGLMVFLARRFLFKRVLLK